jgi:lipopolysaccharide/colanic/teichoic acid biosynthesis glycosyltransferase
VAALAVRASSPGSVLFRQRRVGREGREFTMLKFRTMVADAEERLAEVEHLNEAVGHFFKISEDPRITSVGRHLRRWSIDELPQLWNVLRGDMSMVGPRPPLPDEVSRYDTWHLRRLRVRPGVTGIWQTSGRSDVPFDEAVRMDLFYIENWSLGTDLYLLGRTAGAVLTRRGAR